MSFLKQHGLDLELLAAKASGLIPGRRRRENGEPERKLEERVEAERKASIERARRTEDTPNGDEN